MAITAKEIEAKNLVVAAKIYARSQALPLDASEIYSTMEEAQTYAKSPIAYGGQTIKVLEDGKYETYVLNGEAGNYTLDKIGADSSQVKNYVKVVEILPNSGQEQGVIYVNTADSKGYIWDGSSYKVIFEDVTTEDGKSLQEQLSEINGKFAGYAPLAGATFTGEVVLAADPTKDLGAATKQYVDRLVGGLNDFTVGIVDSSTPLPATGYKVGQTFRVAEAGTYAGQTCETGDLVIVIKDHEADSASAADFLVVNANIDGAVTGPDASTDADIVVFDGATGRKIKDSTVALGSLQDAIAKVHEHANKTQLDSFTKDLSTIETEYKKYADSKVMEATADIVTDEELTSALGDYYTKTEVDNKVTPIEQSLNSKVDAEYVAGKIGAIPQDKTVKDYVDSAVQSGGADVSGAIEEAKQEAITKSKAYTDQVLTIVGF